MNYNKYIKIITLVCVILAISILSACASFPTPTHPSVETTDPASQSPIIRVGSLKGPTSMGLLFLMQEAQKGEANGSYEFKTAVQADELLPLMAKGELDIALLPANVAAILYQKMEGQLTVIDINTLGVLYIVTGNSSITSMGDLKGRTIYLTGKGTTPDYVLRYLLAGNGLTENDCKLEYRSEATEVAALLSQNPEAVGLLPQPFVSVACAQNEALSVVLDMNAEWTKLQGEEGTRMVTGVTVVRKAFLEAHEEAVTMFMNAHQESIKKMNSDLETGARLAAEAGIIAKEPIARKAIPACNITYIDGETMKQALSGYLSVLYDQNPVAVGGELPTEEFYLIVLAGPVADC